MQIQTSYYFPWNERFISLSYGARKICSLPSFRDSWPIFFRSFCLRPIGRRFEPVKEMMSLKTPDSQLLGCFKSPAKNSFPFI